RGAPCSLTICCRSADTPRCLAVSPTRRSSDLLLWHAEMGRALPDVWTGRRQRGVQLHDLEDAVRQWTGPYGQRAWFRQISPDVRSEEHTSELQSRFELVCRLLLEKKHKTKLIG